MSNAVTTTVYVKANDQASDQLGKVNKSLQQSAKATEDAAKQAEHFAEKSGDMEKGVKGVRDILGTLGAGPLADVADKFGGIEAIIKGFGPSLGPVALAIAAVGAGVTYWYQKEQEAQKALIEGRQKEIEQATDTLAKLADRYGVEARIFGIEEDRSALAESRNKLQDLLNKQKEAEKQLAEASAKQETDKADTLRNDMAWRKDAIKEERDHARELIQAEKDRKEAEQDRLDAAKMKELDYQKAVAEKEAGIANIKNLKVRAETQHAFTLKRIKDVQDEIYKINYNDRGERTKTLELTEQLKNKTLELLGLQKKLADDDKSEKDRRKAAYEQTKQHNEEIRKAREQARLDSMQARAEMENDPRVKQMQEAALVAAKYEAERADLEKRYAKDKKTLAIELQALDDKTLANEYSRLSAVKQRAQTEQLANAQALADAEAKSRQAEIDMTQDPAERYALQVLDMQIAKQRELDQVRAANALSEQTRQAQTAAIIDSYEAKRMAMATADAERKKSQNADQIAGAISVSNTIVSALEQEGASRRQIAALRAAIEVAEVYANFPNVPKMISHGIAAALYAKAALTATPTATGGQNVASGAIAQASGTTMSGATGSGGNVQIVLSRGFVVGTPAQVGKAVAGALGAAKGTGFAMPKGV